MKYETIDFELSAWATRHGLQIFTEYKDCEVRSTEVVGSSGKKCQIWVDRSNWPATFVIHIWDYKKRKKKLRALKYNITDKLEEAYMTAKSWLDV